MMMNKASIKHLLQKRLGYLGILVTVTMLQLISGSWLYADENIANARGDSALLDQPIPPKMAKVVNDDVKQQRAYPMQPPLIPHTIRGYQVDMRVNKCLSCHARKRTQVSQATMISVTHYLDRDGNFLADISPRRYFCQQCHVTQLNVPALVANKFEDMDSLLNKKKTGND